VSQNDVKQAYIQEQTRAALKEPHTSVYGDMIVSQLFIAKFTQVFLLHHSYLKLPVC
jgi:hypothetical protein